MRINTNQAKGFTLIEVLVVAPIVILFIGGFVGLILTLTGNTLQTNQQNALAYDGQDALRIMEEDSETATQYLATTGTLPSPQGAPSPQGIYGTDAFTNTTNGQPPDALILRLPATTAGPFDATKRVIYSGAGACNSNNPIFTNTIVYFINANTLYKRTIVPGSPACENPWQRSSCAQANVGTVSNCPLADEKILDNVQNLDITYYSGSTALADSAAASANSISISLTLTKSVAGDPVTFTGNSRITGSNIQASGGAPAMPPITAAETSTANPYQTTFSWQPVGNAASYTVTYWGDTTGSSAQTQVAATGSPSFTVTSPARKRTAQISVTVNTTGGGQYNYGTATRSMPRWQNCPMPSASGWQNYGTPYNTAGFTKTTSGIVGLRGLVRSGPIGQPICTLPAGFRPKFSGEKLIFQAAGYQNGASGWARVDILATGEVIPASGDSAWISLDGIMFLADTSNYNWTTDSWLNGWSWYGAGHSTLRSTLDSVGRAHVQGLSARGGAYPPNATMTTLGNSKGPAEATHSPALAGGGSSGVNIYSDGSIVTRASAATHSWQQLQLIYHPSSFNSWQAMPLYNDWGNYGYGWPTAKCYKGSDDVVIMTGLINRPAGDGDGLELSNTATAGCGNYTDGRLLLPAFYNGEGSGRIDIANGSMYPETTNNGWTSLDGVRFIAD